MLLFPAIDMIGGKAVRLVRGDYAQMTVYSDDPAAVAQSFSRDGAEWLHLVDLEGARDGGTPNLETVREILSRSDLKVELGGGIRSAETVEKYISLGVSRVILGTAALRDPDLLDRMVDKYGEKIAVGVDIRDGLVAVKGWTELSGVGCFDFCASLESRGVQTVICTDISRDGAMRGTNLALYREIGHRYGIDIVASGGVSTLEDVKALREMDLYAAIIGKAYYTGAIDLREALEVAK
jgi:phosphoribosylformimino-5-aminoimidazole carboxamide ribotide isomerase